MVSVFGPPAAPVKRRCEMLRMPWLLLVLLTGLLATICGNAAGAGAQGELLEPSPEALGDMALQAGELVQSIKVLQEQIEGNLETATTETERLDAELRRMDPMALLIDSLTKQMKQAQKLLDKHETRIEDNSMKLYEMLMGISDTTQTLAMLRTDMRRVERSAQKATAVAVATQEEAARTDTEFLWPFALGLLLPAGILLYPAGGVGQPRDKTSVAASIASSDQEAPARILLALAGAVLGFMLFGIGIISGASLGGVLGAPFEFLPALLRLSPENVLPTEVLLLLQQLPLVVAMTLLAISVAGQRLSTSGSFLTGLFLGGLLLPLFGHWSNFPGANSEMAVGWLTRRGFSDSGGVVTSALVGGSAALGLRFFTGRASAMQTNSAIAREPTLLLLAVLLLWVGWQASQLSGVESDNARALMLISWASVVGALVTSALLNGMFRSGSSHLWGLPAALTAGAIVAPAAGAQASLAVALLFGVLAGLLHGLLAPTLHRLDGATELAATFTIAGIVAALAPALVGPESFLFSPVSGSLSVQLFGTASALALGVGGGLLLGWLLQRLPGATQRPSVEAEQDAATESAAN